MVGKVFSAAILGIDGIAVQVETDVSDGLPQFDMVGFLASEVREARERVRTAIKNTGFALPPKRYTINLSPADVRKQGNHFDLPIALSVLGALGVISQELLNNHFFIGELSLDGSLRPINGTLSLVYAAKEMGLRRCVVPAENGMEGAVVEGMEIYAVRCLKEAVDYLIHPEKFQPVTVDVRAFLKRNTDDSELDFSDINGQKIVKRATEVAAAGFHNILYIGPPGCGKTMLAKRISTVLPELSLEEAVEITKIHSICGLLPKGEALIRKRPFRSPHHTISTQALAGGGRVPKPGEISLADRGVLFLDELSEFQKAVLEVLRQPLEEREIVISRVHGNYHYPANCQLAAAMNPCKCGYYPNRSKCRCSEQEVRQYLGKISRPLLDRIDICIEVPKLEYKEMIGNTQNETSAKIRRRVEQARRLQKERYRNETILFNSQLDGRLLKKYCLLGKEEEELLKEAFQELDFSARAYHRAVKVARTIADLAGSERIEAVHICEAIGYRSFDKEVWA